MNIEEKKFLNALNIAFFSNTNAVLKMVNFFGSPEKAFNATKKDLKRMGFKIETISNFFKKRQEINIEKEWQKLKRENIKTITKEEKEYPPLLKEIVNPPLLLYIKGEIFSDEKYFACVGTRWPSDYGKMATSDIVGDLTNEGFVIVSGMARGIDTLSHKAALEREKRTIAIIGSGLDIIFPPENKKLSKKIEKSGAIISEFPLSTPPMKYNFPQRNRIIAGMSIGILVIEAKEKSGALITANLAIEEGREVFAVPGSIYSKNSSGCNKLIKQGANLTTSIEDVLLQFNLEKSLKSKEDIKGKTKEENLILNVLKDSPKSINEIIKHSKLSTEIVNSSLILLEIERKIKRSGEKYYINKK